MSEQTIATCVLIIGSGPAGWSAAIYAARAGLEPIVVSGPSPGGQLTITTDVENYPGYAQVVQGPWMMDQFKIQALNVGTRFVTDYITDVDFSKSGEFKCFGKKHTFTSKSVIIATGAQAKWLGLESEDKFKGFGVSGCATCDAFFYKEKDVVVVGGGNTAVEEALYLTKFAKSVTLVHRRATLRAEKLLQQRLFSNKKITVCWNHTLYEVLGQDDSASGGPKFVTGVRLKSTVDRGIKELTVDGVFIAIGHAPSTGIFKGHVAMDDAGYILTDGVKTNVKGIYAAGDVHDKVYRQAVTAASFGCMAALDIEKFLNE